MTKRKDPADMKIARRDDLTVKPRVKTGVNAKQETANERIEALRRTAVNATTNETRELCSPDRPLTEKQRGFVRHWAQGESILSASYKAGYADGGQMAYRMAKDPAILKLYNAEKLAYEEASQMSRVRVMEMLQEAYDMAKIMSEPATMVAAAREVGKMCGYYEPVKKQIDINVSGSGAFARLNKLSDAQLLKLIEEQGDVIDVVATEISDDDAETDE